ncbi:MAG: hypothetical protein AB1679_14610 [Actinomycetota bacterium]
MAGDLAAVTGHGATPPPSLPEVVHLVYDWSAANPDKARLFFLTAPGSTPEISRAWEEFVGQQVRDVTRSVNHPASPGARRASPDGDLAARTAIGTANATALALLSGGSVREADKPVGRSRRRRPGHAPASGRT